VSLSSETLTDDGIVIASFDRRCVGVLMGWMRGRPTGFLCGFGGVIGSAASGVDGCNCLKERSGGIAVRTKIITSMTHLLSSLLFFLKQR
jgi:hypothetical protein